MPFFPVETVCCINLKSKIVQVSTLVSTVKQQWSANRNIATTQGFRESKLLQSSLRWKKIEFQNG